MVIMRLLYKANSNVFFFANNQIIAKGFKAQNLINLIKTLIAI